jgi:hypothetical protein
MECQRLPFPFANSKDGVNRAYLSLGCIGKNLLRSGEICTGLPEIEERGKRTSRHFVCAVGRIERRDDSGDWLCLGPGKSRHWKLTHFPIVQSAKNCGREENRARGMNIARDCNSRARIWCGRVDSNHHGIATASPSSWCVCQFRHDRILTRTKRKYSRSPYFLGAGFCGGCWLGAGCC